MICLTEHDADDRPLKRRQDGGHRDELEAPLGHQHRRGRGQELAGVAIGHRQAEEAGSRQSSNRLSIVVFRLEQTSKNFLFLFLHLLLRHLLLCSPHRRRGLYFS